MTSIPRSTLPAASLALAAVLISGCFAESDTAKKGGTWVVSGPRALMQIRPETGRGISVSGPGVRGYEDLVGLTVDTRNGRVYAVSPERGQIVTLDRDTGVAMDAAPLPRQGIFEVYFDPVTAKLLAWDPDTLDYLSIAPSSGEATVLATGVTERIGPLAYDSSSDTWYSAGGAGIAVVTFDPTTGLKSAVVFDSFIDFLGDRIVSLAYDEESDRVLILGDVGLYHCDFVTAPVPQIGPAFPSAFRDRDHLGAIPGSTRLLAIEQTTNQLTAIDRNTGIASAVGAHGSADIDRLTFDAVNDCFYAVSTGSGQLLAIDPETGRARTFGPTGITSASGLAFDPVGRELFATVDGDSTLYRIDPATGATAPVGPNILMAPDFRGLAFAGEAGTLYGITLGGEVWEIDTTNAASTFVFFTSNSDNRGLTWDEPNDRLVSYDDTQGLPVEIDPLGPSDGALTMIPGSRLDGFAYDSVRERLVAYEALGDVLAVIDLESPSVLPLGELGSELTGLAYDSVGQRAWAFDRRYDSIVTIDAGSGRPVASVICDVDMGFVDLAFDARTGTLHGSYEIGGIGRLATIDLESGMVTDVGLHGFGATSGLAYDTRSATFIASLGGTGGFVTIDPVDATGVLLPGTTSSNLTGLGYDRLSGVLIGFEQGSGAFYRIDPMTGAEEMVGEAVGNISSFGGWRR